MVSMSSDTAAADALPSCHPPARPSTRLLGETSVQAALPLSSSAPPLMAARRGVTPASTHLAHTHTHTPKVVGRDGAGGGSRCQRGTAQAAITTHTNTS